MPVKVQCPQCGKALAVPDAARGKAVRCPDCSTKIAVPAEGSPPAAPPKSPTKPSAAKPAASSGKNVTRKSAPQPVARAEDDDDFLSSLDLRHAEDRTLRICAKCGKPVGEEDLECPYCGMDTRTGQMTAVTRKRLSRKGPDPTEFWKLVWTEPWDFMLGNKALGLRSIVYALVTMLGVAACQYMTWGVCERLPPRCFWSTLAFSLALVFPGWNWHLLMTIITRTMSKKTDAGTVHFDIFLNMALGLKIIFWNIVFYGLPALVLSLPLMLVVFFVGKFALYALAVVPLLFVFMTPIAWCHLAMPVTLRGWLSVMLFRPFFRSFGPTLYVCMILFLVNLLPMILWNGGIGLLSWSLMGEQLKILIHVAPEETATAAVVVAPAVSINWWMFGGAVAAMLAGLLSMCMSFVYSMRVLGQYAYFFHNQMELVTKPPEEEFVRMLPHRGALLITLVIIAALLPLGGGILGGIALRMSKIDLEDMKTGRRDPKGRKLTKRAIAISQAITAFWVIVFVVLIMLYTFEVWPFQPREKPVEVEEKPAAKARR